MNAHKPETTSGEWSAGKTILGDFVVERVLGEGGMGKVYLLKSNTTGMQFAVKRARGLSDADRCSFLVELQTWFDLPEHPNLVPCHFFRTIDAEILIFAEYVEGGSLKSWIDSGKMYEGSHSFAFSRVLNIATQMAWGLSRLHEMGYVHKDIKPHNILLRAREDIIANDVQAMVADFGLARRKDSTDLCVLDGYTPTYCSPEQAEHAYVDHRSDIWSWGLTVLEMLQGGATWRHGSAALQVLDLYSASELEKQTPFVSHELIGILRKCFLKAKDARWESFHDIINALRQISRTNASTWVLTSGCTIDRDIRYTYQRCTKNGKTWEDPLFWKDRLSRLGYPESKLSSHRWYQSQNPKGAAIADIGNFSIIIKAFNEMLPSKCFPKSMLSDLYNVMGYLYEHVGDYPAAIAILNKAIEIREAVVFNEGRETFAPGLARLYGDLGDALVANLQNQEAVFICNKAIKLWEDLVNGIRNPPMNVLSRLYNNKAKSLSMLGQTRDALCCYDMAINLNEKILPFEEGDRKFIVSGDLAFSYRKQAALLLSVNVNGVNFRRENILINKAVSIYTETQRDYNLASSNAEYARLLFLDTIISYRLNQYPVSLNCVNSTLNKYAQIGELDYSHSLAEEVAMALFAKGCILSRLSRFDDALIEHTTAANILENLVQRKNLYIFTHKMVCVHALIANDNIALNRQDEAFAIIKYSLAILAPMVGCGNADSQQKNSTLSMAMIDVVEGRSALVEPAELLCRSWYI